MHFQSESGAKLCDCVQIQILMQPQTQTYVVREYVIAGVSVRRKRTRPDKTPDHSGHVTKQIQK